jgi:5-formyltetrahydrofolate cyclo-ligase
MGLAMTSTAKKRLRRQLLDRRGAVGADDRATAAEAVLRWVAESPAWQAASTVLAYVASGSELSTRPLLAAALAAGKGVVLPRVVDDGVLRLHAIQALAELSPGYRGILEPDATLPEVAITAIDLALVPGVGFDRRGGRLGYGGGWYDRLLGQPGWRCPVWGIAFACQIVDELPLDRHDRPVAAVVSEAGIMPFGA